MNILIIQPGKLGDMVCTTPVFRAIKKHLKNVKLIVAGDKINEQVLHGNYNIDEYIYLSELTTKKIISLDLDVSILLTPYPEILKRLIFSNVKKIIVPKIIGYSPYATKLYKILSMFAIKIPHRMGYYAPKEYLKMLEPLGIFSTDTKKELFITVDSEKNIEDLVNKVEGVKIGIAPGAGNKIKEWPPAKFKELIVRILKEKKATIFLIGGPQDELLGDIIKKNLNVENIVDTIGKLSIEELKALIKKLNLFISADTGPIYIAEAFDIPTIDIIGPVDEREQPPIGEKHVVIIPPNRVKPELFVMNARFYNEENAKILASSTPVQDVYHAVESLLNDRK